MADQPIMMSSGLASTELPLPSPEVVAEIDRILASSDRQAVIRLVASAPEASAVWSAVGDLGRDLVERYAAYRVGYHRGLDALRANGWRGSGYVRWSAPGNRGFLRCLYGLGQSAVALGEGSEAERCAQFLAQLDPSGVPDEVRESIPGFSEE